MTVPDHPTIRNMELTGRPHGKEPKYPVCPVCGEETNTFYRDKAHEIIGCDMCVKTVDAWDYCDEERSEDDEDD